MNRNSLLEKLGRLYAHCSPIVANSNTSHGESQKFIFLFREELQKERSNFAPCFRM